MYMVCPQPVCRKYKINDWLRCANKKKTHSVALLMEAINCSRSYKLLQFNPVFIQSVKRSVAPDAAVWAKRRLL